nr:uncharacterized protein LOC122322245 [Drosophila bipectinata]
MHLTDTDRDTDTSVRGGGCGCGVSAISVRAVFGCDLRFRSAFDSIPFPFPSPISHPHRIPAHRIRFCLINQSGFALLNAKNTTKRSFGSQCMPDTVTLQTWCSSSFSEWFSGVSLRWGVAWLGLAPDQKSKVMHVQ